METAAIYVLNVVPSLSNSSSLMGQCREIRIVEVFFFFGLIASFPFTLWFQFCNEYRQTLLFCLCPQADKFEMVAQASISSTDSLGSSS